ncbi:MAG: diguanylate cyclase, partial [Sulfuritalea sp.]|nr:diguanylate cyclase [Sulfuritalea sp.]
MKLTTKFLMYFVSILAVLVVVLTGLSALSFYFFSIYTTERHARSVAETVKVGLTESMIHGTIDKRQQFLARLSSVPEVKNVQIVRGPEVIRQYGPGLASERSEIDSVGSVLATGKESFKVVDKGDGLTFQAVIPYIATAQGTPNCLECHAVSSGTVLGAVSIDISLVEMRRQAIFAIIAVSLAVLAAGFASLALVRRLMTPLSLTA